MSFGLLAGIAGAFPAIQRGMDDQKARDQADEDRKFQLEQREAAKADRAFGLQQRDRQVAEQNRQDNLNRELAAVPQTREIEVTKDQLNEDSAGNTWMAPTKVKSTVAAPEWVKFKSTAEVLRRNQEFEKADAYEAMSKKAQFADSAQRFHRLKSGAAGMSLEQLAKAASDIYNNDPLPAQIESATPVAGGMQITVRNKDTGVSDSMVVKDQAELLQRLEAYYSPDTYANYLQLQDKRAAELAKPRKLAPGEIEVVGAAPGRNNNPTAAQVRAAAGGAGGGAGAGKMPATVYDQARNMMNDSFGKNDTPAQVRSDAENYLDRVVRTNPGISAARAQRIAIAGALDPSKHTPHFNPATGQIDIAVVDDDKKPYTITPNAFSPEEVASPEFKKRFPQADIKATAEGLIRATAGGDKDKERAIRSAAFDPAAQKKFFDEAQAEADKAVAEALAKNAKLPKPEPEEAIRARAQAGMEEWSGNMRRKLDLVSKFADPPKVEAPKKAPPSPRPANDFGLGATRPIDQQSYFGLSTFQANELAARQARDARAAMPPRASVDRAAADRDPDITRLRREVQGALRAGKSVEANNKLAEIKRIEQERHTRVQ